MRTFVIATLFFVSISLAPAALAAPLITCATLQTGANCTTAAGATGICDASSVCQQNVNGGVTCALYGQGAVCRNAGVSGTCNANNICQPATQGGTQQGTGEINQVQTGSRSTNTGPITLINPLKGGGNLQSFLLNILDFVIQIGGVIVVLMLIFVGYKFVAAQGEPAKITEARSALLWTVVGALILLGSKAIAIGIEATVKALSVGG